MGLPRYVPPPAITGSANLGSCIVPRRKATLWTGMKSPPQLPIGLILSPTISNTREGHIGTTINEMSLKYLLGNCEDFINEESMLQYYGRMMGITINRTPKCHCKLAGEGIEYSWAASKKKYIEDSL